MFKIIEITYTPPPTTWKYSSQPLPGMIPHDTYLFSTSMEGSSVNVLLSGSKVNVLVMPGCLLAAM